MTSSGANSKAMGITIRINASKYSGSPMPLSGQGMLTELIDIVIQRKECPVQITSDHNFAYGISAQKKNA